MEEVGTNQTATSSQIRAPACCVCREPIRAGATKCTHCGSYQDWSRHLLRWSTLLVSLLGIVPLWGIASSLNKIAFSPKTANVEAVLTSCNKDRITVAFANSGKFDGIVTDVNFALMQDGKRNESDWELRPNSNVVVRPNEPPVLVTYLAYIGNTETDFISGPQTDKLCSFVVEINWMDFKGSTKKISRECSCP